MKKEIIVKYVKEALKEDCAYKDITSRVFIEKTRVSSARIIAKENLIVCGVNFAKMTFHTFDKSIKVFIHKKDGEKARKGDVLLSMKGSTQGLLSAERTALNFLTYLSGIATHTNRYVQEVKLYSCKILDTRKTTPNCRQIEKYAVRIGGGKNHRFNLKDMVLIKDNHRKVYKNFISLADAIKIFRKKTKKPIEVEVDTLKEFDDALNGHPDYILLDNMSVAQMKKAVEKANAFKKYRPLLEASGGIRLKMLRRIAQTGVDRISIGAITQTRKAIDLSMELI